MSNRLSIKEEILLAVSISMGALFFATLVTLIIARYSKTIHAWCIENLPCFQEYLEKDDMNENATKQLAGDKVPLMLLGSDKNEFVIPGSLFYEKIQPEMKKTCDETLPNAKCDSNRQLRGESFATEKSRKTTNPRSQSESTPQTRPGMSPRSKSFDNATPGALTKAFSESLDKIRIYGDVKEKRQSILRKTSALADARLSLILAHCENGQQRKTKRHLIQKGGTIHKKDINPFILRRNALQQSEKSPLQVSQISPELYRNVPGRDDSIQGDDDAFDSEELLFPSRGFLSTECSPCNSDDETERSLLDLRPELYDTSRKRSVGFGKMGKIKISLQYLDHSRSKLELFIHYMDHLQLKTGVTGMYVNVILLPEREIVYRSRRYQATKQPILEQSFVFSKRLPTDRFDTSTIRFKIFTLHGQERSDVYGESNYPLARSEIYEKIKTDNILNINPPSGVVSLLIDWLIQ